MTTNQPTPDKYDFTDHSVLRPWVTRVWFDRLFPLLPRWLAANLVTLISTGTLTAIVLGARFAESLGATWYALLQLVALQLYVAGDHLDGMQAKASGTKSPLGDFLDHHCDLWAGCVLCFGFWTLTATAPLWELYAMTVVLISAFAITYIERAERKALHFTSWGTLETIAVLSIFYLGWAIPPVRAWFSADLLPGYPRHMIVAATGPAMAVGAMIIIARRLGRVPLNFLLSLASLVSLSAWFTMHATATLWGWVVLALVGAEFIARVMQAHTLPESRIWPDPVAWLLSAAVWIVPDARGGVYLTAFTVWLVARYVYTIAQIIARWREQWRWFNAGTAP